MNVNKHQNNRTFPFVWPWRGANNEQVSLREALASRKFSYLYLLIIWGIVGILDFASTRNCSGTWQLALQCEYAFWIGNLVEAPLIFFRNLFTTMLFHNGVDHIFFVTIVGVLIIIQSYEVRFGSKETFSMFLLAYLIVGTLFGIFYQSGLSIWPKNEFIQFAFERNWMGGSLGFYFLYGAFVGSSKRPLIFLSIPFVFEFLNIYFFNIDLHISLMHTVGAMAGLATKKVMIIAGTMKSNKNQREIDLSKEISKPSFSLGKHSPK
ncbi:MAG: hypothetical protein ABJG78_15900 [Cyclobacteriaceae bacterium]